MKRFVLFLLLTISYLLLLNYQYIDNDKSGSKLTSITETFIKSIGGTPLYSDLNNNVLNTIYKTPDAIAVYSISDTPGQEIEKSTTLYNLSSTESLIYKSLTFYNSSYICILINNKDILSLTSKIRVKAQVDDKVSIFETNIASNFGSIISFNTNNMKMYEISLISNENKEIYTKYYK
ncbi:MAG: hypothetical protein RR838_07635 [Clostridium sp.]